LTTPCADDDLCLVIYEGPSKVETAAAGTTTLGVGDLAIIATGGRVVKQDNTVAAGAATFAQILGQIGRAIEAVAAINTKFLIDVSVPR